MGMIYATMSKQGRPKHNELTETVMFNKGKQNLDVSPAKTLMKLEAGTQQKKP